MDRITAPIINFSWKPLASKLAAVIGVTFTLIGHHYGYVELRWLFFSIGALCLFFTAVCENQVLLAMLQLILLAGAGAMYANFNIIFRTALPILLSIQTMVFFVLTGKSRDFETIIGCLGILCLALGFTTHNQVISFIGGAAITAYAALLVRQGFRLAGFWIVLNAYFTLSAILNLFTTWIG